MLSVETHRQSQLQRGLLGPSGASAMRGGNARNLASHSYIKSTSFRFFYNKHLIINKTWLL